MFIDSQCPISLTMSYHVSYTNKKENKILLLGGEIQPSTGVELPGEETMMLLSHATFRQNCSGGRRFNLQHAISSACLIPLDQEFVIVGGFSAGVAANFATRWWQHEK